MHSKLWCKEDRLWSLTSRSNNNGKTQKISEQERVTTLLPELLLLLEVIHSPLPDFSCHVLAVFMQMFLPTWSTLSVSCLPHGIIHLVDQSRYL